MYLDTFPKLSTMSHWMQGVMVDASALWHNVTRIVREGGKESKSIDLILCMKVFSHICSDRAIPAHMDDCNTTRSRSRFECPVVLYLLFLTSLVSKIRFSSQIPSRSILLVPNLPASTEILQHDTNPFPAITTSLGVDSYFSALHHTRVYVIPSLPPQHLMLTHFPAPPPPALHAAPRYT